MNSSLAQNIKVLAASDLHQIENLYLQLDKAVDEHKPDIVALVGDFLDSTEAVGNKLSIKDCARILHRLKCSLIIFVPGNHEGAASWIFAEEWQQLGRRFHFLQRACFIHGPLVIVGFPCSMLAGSYDPDFVDLEKWLPKLLRPHLPAARTLWFMHEPPLGTPLSERTGPLSGNQDWTLAIERFSPKIVVFGHDHLTPQKLKR